MQRNTDELNYISLFDDEMAKKELLSSIIENSDDAIVSKTLNGVILSWNRGAEHIFGYSEKEIIGKNIRLLIPLTHQEEEQYIISQIKQGKPIKHYETIRKHKDGSIINISVTVSPIRNKTGNIVAASKIARIITDKIKIQKSLIDSEERYKLVLNGLSVGIWDWNLITNELYWSPRFKCILGIKEENFVPNYNEFLCRLHPDEKDELESKLLAHLKLPNDVKNEPFHHEHRLLNGNGQYIWVYAMGQVSFDENSKPIRMVGSINDITERKESQAKVEERTLELERANSELELFAYAASHDLKAPLRVIDSASKWIEEDLQDRITPEVKESMELLRGRVHRMEKLLDDLLEYSRIGKTRDHRYIEIIPGDEIMKNILEMLSPPPKFQVDVSPNFQKIKVSRMPLQQILMNLIGNSIKHHDKDKGLIEVMVIEEGENFIFSVRDDGPGIPPQFHEKVYKMFETLKPKDQVEGSGIGLAMVQKNIELFGGKLKLESDGIKGTYFEFTWPKKQISKENS